MKVVEIRYPFASNSSKISALGPKTRRQSHAANLRQTSGKIDIINICQRRFWRTRHRKNPYRSAETRSIRISSHFVLLHFSDNSKADARRPTVFIAVTPICGTRVVGVASIGPAFSNSPTTFCRDCFGQVGT